MAFTSSFHTFTPSLCVFRKNMHVKRLPGRIKAKGETEETNLGFCSNSTVTVSAVTWKNRYCSHWRTPQRYSEAESTSGAIMEVQWNNQRFVDKGHIKENIC